MVLKVKYMRHAIKPNEILSFNISLYIKILVNDMFKQKQKQ